MSSQTADPGIRSLSALQAGYATQSECGRWGAPLHEASYSTHWDISNLIDVYGCTHIKSVYSLTSTTGNQAKETLDFYTDHPTSYSYNWATNHAVNILLVPNEQGLQPGAGPNAKPAQSWAPFRGKWDFTLTAFVDSRLFAAFSNSSAGGPYGITMRAVGYRTFSSGSEHRIYFNPGLQIASGNTTTNFSAYFRAVSFWAMYFSVIAWAGNNINANQFPDNTLMFNYTLEGNRQTA